MGESVPPGAAEEALTTWSEEGGREALILEGKLMMQGGIDKRRDEEIVVCVEPRQDRYIDHRLEVEREASSRWTLSLDRWLDF